MNHATFVRCGPPRICRVGRVFEAHQTLDDRGLSGPFLDVYTSVIDIPFDKQETERRHGEGHPPVFRAGS